MMMHIRRKYQTPAWLFAAVVVSLAASVFESAAHAAEPAKRPNFVIILADDLGYGDLSCYGNREYHTPHLDSLAAQGMKFVDFQRSGPVCSPTRAGLLTGRYQQRAGIPGVIVADFQQNRHHGLYPKEWTFAELLKNAGYATAIFGKWHLGYLPKFNPIHHGFDRFRGYVSGNIDYHSHIDRVGVYDWWDGDKTVEEPGYSTHLITRHTLRFIEDNKDKPFCVYVAHEAPHTPFQGPNDKPFRVKGKVVPEKRSADFKKRAYREMVQEMDKGVGAIIETLKRLHLDSRTLVFFFSDNGATAFGQNGRLRGHKGQLWEGGHRVPAIAWWPGQIKPGTVSEQLAICLDVMPTILELAGVQPPDGHPLDGKSLVPVLFGKKTFHRTLFWEYRNQVAMRDGAWKLVRNLPGQKTPALYDLAEDLSETNDLAAQQPKRVQAMLKAIATWQTDVAKGATKQTEKPLSRD